MERHAAVLGLSACVASCPYDSPDWLADSLVALAAWAGEPAGPVKDSVNKAFGDFKRTHHDTWAATKEAFGHERWALITDLELSPSYFA